MQDPGIRHSSGSATFTSLLSSCRQVDRNISQIVTHSLSRVASHRTSIFTRRLSIKRAKSSAWVRAYVPPDCVPTHMSISIPPRQQDALHTSLLTARSLVLLQLLSRLLTFGLNQSLVRMASPEVFGTAAIQFDLVSSTILFLSREGIRNALLRTKQGSISKEEVGERQVRALSTVPLPLGMAIATAVCTVYLYSSSFATTSQTTFHLSLGLYVLAALLELAVEPLYLRALRSSPPKMIVRVQAEGGMVIAKAIVTATSLLVLKGKPLLGFALGQLAGAAWLAGRYLFEYGDATSLDWVGAARG